MYKFMANITDGYSLRNTICMIKNEIDEITFILTKKEMTITFLNKGQYATHDISIKTSELQDYIYNFPDSTHPLTVNTTQLFNATKSVGRKDSLKIYLKEGDEKLSIQPIKSTKEQGRSNALYVDIIHKNYTKYEFVNEHSEGDPTVKIVNREFADICGQASTLKCQYLEISGCANYIDFKGLMPDGTYGMTHRLTSSESFNDNVVVVVKVPINTIKTLSKLHNISPSGSLIKWSFAPKKPIKIESHIGSYGIYKICLRDYKMIK